MSEEIDLDAVPVNVEARPIGASDVRRIDQEYHLVVKEAIEKHREGRRHPVKFWFVESDSEKDDGKVNLGGLLG